MFLFLFTLTAGFGIFAMAIHALQTERAWVIWGTFARRASDPVTYWLSVTSLLVTSVIMLVRSIYLICQAALSEGPYAEHAFFSFHGAWNFGASIAVMLTFACLSNLDRLRAPWRRYMRQRKWDRKRKLRSRKRGRRK